MIYYEKVHVTDTVPTQSVQVQHSIVNVFIFKDTIHVIFELQGSSFDDSFPHLHGWWLHLILAIIIFGQCQTL